MALNRFINITLDANASKKPDRVDHRHEPKLGASASGDVCVAFDTAKITSMSMLKSAIDTALQQAAGTLRPCILLALLLLASLAPPARAQAPAPGQGVGITASSGNVAAATATATLAAAVGKVTYICGFMVTSGGSTGALIVNGTITNTVTGTMTFTYATVAGATLGNTPLVVPFTPCISAATPNTTIPVSLPTLGAGNTNTTVSAWGYQR